MSTEFKMGPAAPDHAKSFTIGYDLDGGGYAFEACHVDFARAMVAAGLVEGDASVLLGWDDPDFDYFPFGTDAFERYSHDSVLLIVPNDGHYPETAWPLMFEHEQYRYTLQSKGIVFETDHDCNCHGELVEWIGAAGEGPALTTRTASWLLPELIEQGLLSEPRARSKVGKWAWTWTGNTKDRPYPECTRCDGDGYVLSPGGCYAWYTLEDIEDEDSDADDGVEEDKT